MPILCRDGQVELLESYLDPCSCPPAIGVHGPPSTGKSFVLRQILADSELQDLVWINVDQCLTPRLVLQKALTQFSALSGAPFNGSCENIQIFFELFTEMVTQMSYEKRVVLVLDRIDVLEEHLGLIIGFSRSPEFLSISNLMVVFVYSSPEPKPLIGTPVPHIMFPRYTPEEVVKIMRLDPLPDLRGATDSIYREFVRVGIMSLHPYTDTDIVRLRLTLGKLWPKFVEGGCSSSFAAQFKAKSNIFRSEQFIDTMPVAQTYDFPVELRYLLCAAFLASHNHERYDFKFFSRAKDLQAKRRKTNPKKEAVVPQRAKPAQPFEMERLMAIHHALAPETETYVSTTRTYQYLADLASQKLVVRELAGVSFPDVLDSRTRWSVNVSFQFAKKIADSIDLPLENYMTGEQ